LQQEYQLGLRWTAFPLHPETPEEGQTLEELFAGQGKDIPGMLARLKQVAAAEGLPFGDRKMTFNSRLAQELGKWAELQGKGQAFHRAIFRAYFADGLNIGKRQILLDVAVSLGLPAEEAKTVLAQRSFRTAVDQDWERSEQLGIDSVPTFAMAGRTLAGVGPYEELARFVLAGGGRKRV